MVTMDDAKQRNNTTDFAVEHPARPEFIIQLKGQDGGTKASEAVHIKESS